jgi:hypothetical protein
MLNGLYEIVVELGEQGLPIPASEPAAISTGEAAKNQPAPSLSPAEVLADNESNPPKVNQDTVSNPKAVESLAATLSPEERPTPPKLATATQASAPAAMSTTASQPKRLEMVTGSIPVISGQETIVLASAPTSPNGTLIQAPLANRSNSTTLEGLAERAQRVKAFEPLKALFSRSLVKTSEGEAICEYFYPVQSPKENRKYVFNAPFTLLALLQVLQRDPTGFHSRLEMAAGDLLSRLDHGGNIGLEDALKSDFNRDALSRLLGLAWKPREQAFKDLAIKVISRLESLGAMRSKNLEDQFNRWK